MGRLSPGDLWSLLDDIPRNIRLDVVQLALDLTGIPDQTGVADATNAFISLLRGDLLGAVVSGASILPVGDLAKVVKFRKYATSLQTLVSIALRRPRLAAGLRQPMRQLRRLTNSIHGFMGDSQYVSQMVEPLNSVRQALDRYLGKMTMIDRFGVVQVARKSGHSAAQYVGHSGSRVTVNGVVDTLVNATNSSQKKVADEADDLLGKLALSDKWDVTASVHRSGTDHTQHITVLVEGIDGQFHLRVDKRGHLFEITHGPLGTPLSDVPIRNY